MKLRDKIDYSAFLRNVQKCSGEVLLVTPEGDQLNLKSTLSQFVFTAALSGSLDFTDAKLVLADSEDAALLEAFVTAEG